MFNKVQSAIKNIETCLSVSKKPCLAWSGGKDSMALLDLVFKKVGVKVPVVFYREQWQPSKYAFQNRIIEEWGLEVYTWHPTFSSFQQTDDEFEVQNKYIFDNTDMTCPTGITPIEEDKPWVCAMDIYNRPKNPGIIAGWDGMLVGHKLCDSDPIYGGDAGVRVDVRINPGQCNAFYPMKNWTHDDVFQYCEENNVPIQTSRYEKVNGKWSEKVDRTHNCDYVHACTACIDRRKSAPKFVHCPKLDCTIENISQRVLWFDQSIPSFMKD
jgi:hypothetical protein